MATEKQYGVRLYGPESKWLEEQKKSTGKGYARIIEKLIQKEMDKNNG